MDIGQRIKEHRLRLGFTQEELGAKLGVKKSAVGKWENGHTQSIKRATLYDLSVLFDLKSWELMGWQDDKKITGLEISDEKKLLDCFRQLNDLGKSRTLEDIEEKTKSETYTNKGGTEEKKA